MAAIQPGVPLSAAVLNGLRGQRGTLTINANNATSVTGVVVTFPVPFANTPHVSIGIVGGGGTYQRWVVRAINVSNVGFSIYAQSTNNTAGTFTDMPLSWHAID